VVVVDLQKECTKQISKPKLLLKLTKLRQKHISLNHPDTTVITKDIRKVSIVEIKKKPEKEKTIHLLAGAIVHLVMVFFFYQRTLTEQQFNSG